ncbi:hypothetical protein ACOSP7_025249 [Xanthoceras sorbifolium]
MYCVERLLGGKKFMETLGKGVELLGVFKVGDYIPWLCLHGGGVSHFNGLHAQVDKVARELHEFQAELVDEHEELRIGWLEEISLKNRQN